MALPTLLYGCETWEIREQEKSTIASVEMKFARTENYTWQDYITNKDQNLKLNKSYRKFKIMEMNGYNMFDECTETDCHMNY